MTLTQWWQTLLDNLETLKQVYGLDELEQWKAAKNMADLGKDIEKKGITYAYNVESTIINASKRLGKPINPNEAAGIPDVSSPQQLLFAYFYYRHLCLFNDIQSGWLMQQGINSKKGSTKKSADALKSRIEGYLNNPSNIDAIKSYLNLSADITELSFTLVDDAITAKLKKDSELKQVEEEHSCEKTPPLVSQIEDSNSDVVALKEKLCSKIESDAQKIIDEYTKDQAISTLYTNLDAKVKETEQTLRTIASCQQSLQVINQNIKADSPTVEDKSHSTQPLPSSPTIGVVASSKWLLRKGIDVIQWVGRFGKLSTFTDKLDLIKPYSPDEQQRIAAKEQQRIAEEIQQKVTAKKQELLSQRNEAISKLNRKENQQFTANDFENLNSKQIERVADKFLEVRRIIYLQESIQIYHKRYNTGLVKFSLSGIIGKITTMLSKSFLRPLLFEVVLFQLEIKKLQDELRRLKEQTTAIPEESSENVQQSLIVTIQRTRQEVDTITQKSRYLLFKKRTEKASKEVTGLLISATATLSGGES